MVWQQAVLIFLFGLSAIMTVYSIGRQRTVITTGFAIFNLFWCTALILIVLTIPVA